MNYPAPENATGQNEEVWLAERLLRKLPAWDRVSKDHTQKTPERFVKMLHQMTDREDFEFTTFPSTSDEMVVLHPIRFYTFCAHHIVPFYGYAYIGYVPDVKVAGLSKFPRAVRYIAKGFHVQEELTGEIADFLEGVLKPKGLAIVLEAEHLCAAMRGVEEHGMITTTSAMRGVFLEEGRGARAEFLQLISTTRH